MTSQECNVTLHFSRDFFLKTARVVRGSPKFILNYKGGISILFFDDYTKNVVKKELRGQKFPLFTNCAIFLA